MKKEKVVFNKSMIVVALILLFVFKDQELFAQSLVTKVSSGINEVWAITKVVCFFAFVAIVIIGGLVVYGKTTGENPQSFMTAALGWFKGLGFILIVFSVVGGLKVVFDMATGSISF